jgi:hypothetical protein
MGWLGDVGQGNDRGADLERELQRVQAVAACYNTPYAAFMANSFRYNARLLGFDGIRFDTRLCRVTSATA